MIAVNSKYSSLMMMLMVTVMIKDETLLCKHYICLFLANLGLNFNLCEQYNVFLFFLP